MKFPRDSTFDSQFDMVPNLKWYPYVGNTFRQNSKKIFIYAHNIPIKPEDFQSKSSEWKSKSTWADCIEEYTYEQSWYTEAFRYFIKGAVGLKENYNRNSTNEITIKVDNFISSVSYSNFIQGLVMSSSQIAKADGDLVAESIKINKEILGILEITHCICWGNPVFEYIKSIPGWTVGDEIAYEQKGFGYCLARTDSGARMHVLKIHHPSMPNFRPYSKETQSLISDFLMLS